MQLDALQSRLNFQPPTVSAVKVRALTEKTWSPVS